MFTPSASRTRTRTIACTVLIVGLVLLSAAVAAPVVAQDDDPPPLPASYYGSIEFDGEPAPAGITIEAEVNGEVVGSITTDESGEYGGATVADDKLVAEGDHSDEEVRFFVSGDGFDRTEADTDPDEVIWEAGAVAQVDLSVPIDASEVSGGTDDGSTDDGADAGDGGDTIDEDETAEDDSAADDGADTENDSATGEDDAIDENTTDSEVDDEDGDDDAIGNETTDGAADTNETTAADEDSGTGAGDDEGGTDEDNGDDGSTGGSETDNGDSGDGEDEGESSEEDVVDDDSPGFGLIAAIAAVLASIALGVGRDRS